MAGGVIAGARERAEIARRNVREGKDPLFERAKSKRGAKPLTVREVIDACFEARKAEQKGAGKNGKWMNPLLAHIIPKIFKYPIEEVDQISLNRRWRRAGRLGQRPARAGAGCSRRTRQRIRPRAHGVRCRRNRGSAQRSGKRRATGRRACSDRRTGSCRQPCRRHVAAR